MRKKRKNGDLEVNAIAGAYVVMLGINYPRNKCNGLLGFGILKTDAVTQESRWLRGIKTFAETDPGFQPGTTYSTQEHPIQGFTWADYEAEPGRDYTYKVVAFKGTPQNLSEADTVSVKVRTEGEADGNHDIYFNRGVAASQQYARLFGDRKPDEVGQQAFDWLSRGLFEEIERFIGQAGAGDTLLVCAYEFHFEPILRMLKSAKNDNGATVKIIFDQRKKSPGDKNAAAVKKVRIKSLCTPRTSNTSAISHNKFIVYLKNGQPTSVLTGGTNFSESGIFGHANNIHVVQDPTVAASFETYWNELEQDPASKDLRPILNALVPVPNGKPPNGTTVVFSPRKGLDILQWYADRAMAADNGLFMTFAFGMNDMFQDVYRNGTAPMRYALMEKATRPMKRGSPERLAAENAIRDLRFMPENRFAIGSHLRTTKFDRWISESLSNLNRNVKYVHNKFMLIDPLTTDPIVISGSANFSAASTTKNDENMLIIRGNTRVADVYLGEFMRLYRHHAFREFVRRTGGKAQLKNLDTTNTWWREYFENSARANQRKYFAGQL